MIINRIRLYLGNLKRNWLIDHFPRLVIDKDFPDFPVNWDNPRNINEKIQWLICYGDTSLWPDFADKYKVRKYIEEKGYGHLLTKLYGIYHKASEINFEELPDKFVLKCNHDCGSYHIIDKKNGFNKESIRQDLDNHLKTKFGYIYCEPHYNKITPRIIAEEFLNSTEPKESFSSSLVDYKVWCFDGKPYCVFVAYSRTKEHLYTNVYDLDWNVHPEYSVFTGHCLDGKGMVPRPKCLQEMLKAASDLSKGFPQVRVDFYVVNNKLYFGEMTFTSACGRMDYFTDEYLYEMGKQCILPIKGKN